VVRAEGLLAGVSLNGATLRPDADRNLDQCRPRSPSVAASGSHLEALMFLRRLFLTARAYVCIGKYTPVSPLATPVH